MQEHPADSLNNLRLLLSRYLDGSLEDDRLADVTLMLDRPEVQAELLKLQTANDLLHRTLQRLGEHPESCDTALQNRIRENILRQLACDHAAMPISRDSEFHFETISAYYDRELDASTQRTFEAQLSNNPDANRMLADLHDISEAIRRFAYRQEDACALDVTAQVMRAYRMSVVLRFTGRRFMIRKKSRPDMARRRNRIAWMSPALWRLPFGVRRSAQAAFGRHPVSQKSRGRNPVATLVFPASAAAVLLLLSIPGPSGLPGSNGASSAPVLPCGSRH